MVSPRTLEIWKRRGVLELPPFKLLVGSGGHRKLPAILIHQNLVGDDSCHRLARYHIHAHFVVANLILNGKSLGIISIHLPSDRQTAFEEGLADMQNLIALWQLDQWLIGSDANTTFNIFQSGGFNSPVGVHLGPTMMEDHARANELLELLATNGLQALNTHFPGKVSSTSAFQLDAIDNVTWTSNGSATEDQRDFLFATRSLAVKCVGCQVIDADLGSPSDHRPLLGRFDLNLQVRVRHQIRKQWCAASTVHFQTLVRNGLAAIAAQGAPTEDVSRRIFAAAAQCTSGGAKHKHDFLLGELQAQAWRLAEQRQALGRTL